MCTSERETTMILDEFAGPGGWDEGLRMIGRTDVVGIELDQSACETAVAAGHTRIRADVSQYPSEPFVGRLDAYIASPPCQAWSLAGNKKGELDRINCHKLADRMAFGDDSTSWTGWEDTRSALVCQPIRRIRDLRPPRVALEEVPPVAPLWVHFAEILRGWGYSVWTGDLCSADYGVAQIRNRRFLLASLDGLARPPEPTHARFQHGADLFGGSRDRWVSMAETIGWGYTDRPSPTICAGGDGKYTGAEWGGSSVRQAMRETSAWVDKEGSFSRDTAEAIRLSVSEASVLQTFPPDYPWRGIRSRQYEKIGNAVPPLVAAHVCAALGLGEL